LVAAVVCFIQMGSQYYADAKKEDDCAPPHVDCPEKAQYWERAVDSDKNWEEWEKTTFD